MTDPLQQFRLDGRVAVVTGASSGMGVVFAETLAIAGARVVLAARREELLNAVAEGIRKRGGEALALCCDVAREDEIDALVAKTLAAFGSIDVLVNNADLARRERAAPRRAQRGEASLRKRASSGGARACA